MLLLQLFYFTRDEGWIEEESRHKAISASRDIQGHSSWNTVSVSRGGGPQCHFVNILKKNNKIARVDPNTGRFACIFNVGRESVFFLRRSIAHPNPVSTPGGLGGKGGQRRGCGSVFLPPSWKVGATDAAGCSMMTRWDRRLSPTLV